MDGIYHRKHSSKTSEDVKLLHKSPKQISILMQDSYVLACLLFLRLVNVFMVQTWFVPDEYWQSLEVAHDIVFGYGYLTWEWKVGIRSALHPLLFAPIYYLLEWTGANETELLIYSPRIFQAFISAISEWYFYLFVKKHFSQSVANFTAVGIVISWFWWYCCTRTLINSLEAAMICFSFRFYPWALTDKLEHSSIIKFTCVAVFTTIIRPTSVTAWFPLFMNLFYRMCCLLNFKTMLTWGIKVSLIAIAILTLSLVVDLLYYGHWLSIHYNFLKFNVISNQGTFYGSHPWHWYLSQGIPVVVGTNLPLAMYGMWITFWYKGEKSVGTMSPSNISRHVIYNVFYLIILCTLVLYSIPGHKEFRFILSLLPLFCLFSGIVLSNSNKHWQKFLVIFLAISNVPLAIYTGLIHQSGPTQVMKHLRKEVLSMPPMPSNAASKPLFQPLSVLFLMPCHSTPYYSFLHSNASLQFLTCEPDFDGNGRQAYLDEAEIFYSNPMEWTRNNVINDCVLGNDHQVEQCIASMPDRIVLFDVLYENLRELLAKRYDKCHDVFHTHFPEGRVGNTILVLCKNRPAIFTEL